MKKVIMVAMVLVLMITGASFAFQNEPEGFRGLKWGDAPTEDMVKEALGAWVGNVELKRYKIGETYVDRMISPTSFCF